MQSQTSALASEIQYHSIRFTKPRCLLWLLFYSKQFEHPPIRPFTFRLKYAIRKPELHTRCSTNIKLLLPKAAVFIEPHDRVFFIGGPVLGGGDWQCEAIRHIAMHAPGSYVVCPCRYESDHPLYRFSIQGADEACWISKGFKPFLSQTLWERFYLDVANEQGSIIFWLGKESTIHPRPPKTEPYARDTYGEIGEWRARMFYDNARVVVGASPEFPGLSVIKKNFDAMPGPSFPIHETLLDTVKAAVAVANKR